MITLGCDPDTHTPSLAIVDDRRLLWFWQGVVPSALKDEEAVVAAIRAIDERKPGFPCVDVGVAAIEQMRIYGKKSTDKLKTSGINSLIRLASVGGAAASFVHRCFPDCKIVMPTPPEWKGQRSKKADHARTLALLDQNKTLQDLMEVPSKNREHILDAIGLALWAQTDRYKKRELRKDLRAAARKEAKKAKG